MFDNTQMLCTKRGN